MVRFIGLDEATARRRLLAVGTEIVQIGSEGSELEAEILAGALPEGRRHVRGTFEALPPAPGEEHDAHCAWHTNAVTEAHTINSGLGLFEFWTEDGVVTVVTEPGDLLVNRGVEHRFLPVAHQQLRLHHSGESDQDFGYVATGRTPAPWPSVD
jgi:hypothetical protein